MLPANPNDPSTHPRPWLPTTRAGFAAAVDRLKQRHKESLFVVLTRAAASGDWGFFNATMERAARVKGVADFLEGGSEFTVALLYERTGLPSHLYPLFAAVVTLSWTVCHEVKGVRPGRPLRVLILNKVFQRAEIEALAVPQDIRAALYG
jgi:hypothetical protein